MTTGFHTVLKVGFLLLKLTKKVAINLTRKDSEYLVWMNVFFGMYTGRSRGLLCQFSASFINVNDSKRVCLTCPARI